MNNRASHLARGRHDAQIAIRSPQAARTTKGGRTIIRYKTSVDVVLYAQIPCDLRVTGGSYSARAERGGVPQLYSVAKLSNAGDAPCNWEAHSDRPWLTIDPPSGTIPSKGIGGFRIRANSGAAQLVPDDYDATVTLSWSETGPEVLEINAVLEIDAPPCALHFPEGQIFEAKVKAGSTDFSAAQTKFLLENQGGTPCHIWEAHHSARWLTIDSDATIHTGNATEVVVEVNRQEIVEMRPGTYNRTITFGAGNQYAVNTLAARLTIEPLPCHLEIEIEEDELYFHIEPEGLLESETEKPIVLRNNWTNRECHWRVESRHDWLTAEPRSGILLADEEVTVTAKLLRTSALSQLDAGNHPVNLGFVVEEGISDGTVPVTVSIECKPGEPCAYLHTSHTTTLVGQPATISLSVVNGWQQQITAQLNANMPSGWELKGVGFAEKCGGGVCNQIFPIQPAQTEFIEFRATPNNAGQGAFRATVTWITNAGENVGESDEASKGPEVTHLYAQVDVMPISGAVAPQISPTVTPAPTDQPTALPSVPTATLEPATVAASSAPSQQTGGSAPEERIVVQQVGLPPIVWAVLAGVVVLLVIGVVASLFRRRRRRTSAIQIDYAELAREINRQRRDSEA